MGARRLPLHPQPLPDEALSSWVRRLGAIYGLDIERFLSHALGSKEPLPITCDCDMPDHVVETLSERTGVPPRRIRQMTLAGCYTPLLIDTLRPCRGLFTAYVGQFETFVPIPPRLADTVQGLDEAAWLPWIAADLLRHEHARCCRRCLVEDPTPYVRLHWRAAWMASCPIHGELLEAVYVDLNDPGWCYALKPAQVAPADLTFIDRLTLTAVTTGVVQLPCGREIHAGIWLRLLRTLVDEIIRPAAHLRAGARARVTQLWRGMGRHLHQGLGRSVPFEAMTAERRKLVLTIAGAAAQALVTGDLSSSNGEVEQKRSALLRPPLRTDLPDLVSRRPPPRGWPRGSWWNEWIAEARHDEQTAWRVRSLLNLSTSRRERAEMDAYLAVIGVPVVRSPPQAPPVGPTTNS